MDLVASSTIVRKYLKPSWVALAKGPYTSQCIKSKACSDIWLELGKGNLLNFAMGQTTHSLLEWKEGTSDTHWGSLSSDTCPNLRYHKYDLLIVESLETEWTKDLKTDSRIVVASEAVLQVSFVCSR